MPKVQKTVRRNTSSGSFLHRGEKIGGYTVMGTNPDGTIILAPKQKPSSFTVRELHEAVRVVKNERRSKLADSSS